MESSRVSSNIAVRRTGVGDRHMRHTAGLLMSRVATHGRVQAGGPHIIRQLDVGRVEALMRLPRVGRQAREREVAALLLVAALAAALVVLVEVVGAAVGGTVVVGVLGAAFGDGQGAEAGEAGHDDGDGSADHGPGNGPGGRARGVEDAGASEDVAEHGEDGDDKHQAEDAGQGELALHGEV